MDKEFITVEFKASECIETKRNNIPVGIIKGYLATWDIDRGNDRFEPGAFAEALKEMKKQGRNIRMFAYHNSQEPIGMFPIEYVKEDSTGLWVEGEINLNTAKGQDVYALIQQGALSDMSIGYRALDFRFEGDIRIIEKSLIWEGSVVPEPMNTQAQILEVKGVNTRAKLPKSFADRGYRWDSNKAEKRVRAWSGSDEEPNTKYKQAFLWWAGSGEKFGDYKLQVADIIEGSIKIVPRAVFAVRAVLAGARGGVDIPEADIRKIKGIINTLYEDMELDAPFTGGKSIPYTITELKNLQRGFVEHIIRHEEISRGAADLILKGLERDDLFLVSDETEETEVMRELEEIAKIFKGA